MDGNLWYTFYNGKQNLIVQNAGTEAATVCIPVDAAAAELLNSAAAASLENGIFSVQLAAGEAAFVRLYDIKPTGIYVGNILYRQLPAEPAVFLSDGEAYCAVYKPNDGVPELISLYVSGDVITPADEDCITKILHWDGMDVLGKAKIFPEFF